VLGGLLEVNGGLGFVRVCGVLRELLLLDGLGVWGFGRTGLVMGLGYDVWIDG